MEVTNNKELTSIRCIGTGFNGSILTAALSTEPDISTYSLKEGTRIIITEDSPNGIRTVIDTTNYPLVEVDGVRVKLTDIMAITSSEDDVYIITRMGPFAIPNVVRENRINPMWCDRRGYDPICEGYPYIYNLKTPDKNPFIILNPQGTNYKRHGWGGVNCTIINDSLVYYEHGNNLVVECAIIDSDMPVKRDHLPSNMFAFVDNYNSYRTRITGYTIIGEHIITTFNNTHSDDDCQSIIARYDSQSRKLIDGNPVIGRNGNGKSVHSSMDHMCSNGNLIVGIDTLRDSICILNSDTSSASYFKLSESFNEGGPIPDLTRMTDIAIDYMDNIRLVTSDRKRILLMTSSGRCIGVLDSPMVQRSD